MKKTPIILSLTALNFLTAVTSHALVIPQSELNEADAERAYAAVMENDASIDFSSCVITNIEELSDDETKFEFTLYSDQGEESVQGDISCEDSVAHLTTAADESELYAMAGGGMQQQGGKTQVRYYKPSHKIIIYKRQRDSHEKCNPFAKHHIKHFHSRPSVHHKVKKPSGKAPRPSKQGQQ